MAKSNWDEMKERFDKNCPLTPEYYEKVKELHKMVENGEAYGKGGLTPDQRADLERRAQECRELEKKYEGVGTVFSRDNYVIDGGDIDD